VRRIWSGILCRINYGTGTIPSCHVEPKTQNSFVFAGVVDSGTMRNQSRLTVARLTTIGECNGPRFSPTPLWTGRKWEDVSMGQPADRGALASRVVLLMWGFGRTAQCECLKRRWKAIHFPLIRFLFWC